MQSVNFKRTRNECYLLFEGVDVYIPTGTVRYALKSNGYRTFNSQIEALDFLHLYRYSGVSDDDRKLTVKFQDGVQIVCLQHEGQSYFMDIDTLRGILFRTELGSVLPRSSVRSEKK